MRHRDLRGRSFRCLCLLGWLLLRALSSEVDNAADTLNPAAQALVQRAGLDPRVPVLDTHVHILDLTGGQARLRGQP